MSSRQDAECRSLRHTRSIVLACRRRHSLCSGEGRSEGSMDCRQYLQFTTITVLLVAACSSTPNGAMVTEQGSGQPAPRLPAPSREQERSAAHIATSDCECNGGDRCCCLAGQVCCNTPGSCCCESASSVSAASVRIVSHAAERQLSDELGRATAEQFGFGLHCYEMCCPSGDCDSTCCVNEGAHVDCPDGHANTSCNSF